MNNKDLDLLKTNLEKNKDNISIEKRIEFSNNFKVNLTHSLKSDENLLTKEDIEKIIIDKESIEAENIFHVFEIFNINKSYEFILENLNFDISYPLVEKLVEILSFYDRDDLFYNSKSPKHTQVEEFMIKQNRKLDFENFLSSYYDKKSSLEALNLAAYVYDEVYKMQSLNRLNTVMASLLSNLILIKNSYLPLVLGGNESGAETLGKIYQEELDLMNEFLRLAD